MTNEKPLSEMRMLDGKFYFKDDVEQAIKDFKEKKDSLKDDISYKRNPLNYKIGMIHGFEFAMREIDKIFGSLK